ncbi:MAG TPA: cation transporter [Hellea balneolensis]|uniref:Cation transporter n=1 Tax=Hellea balneolensis TaxID=287478 RepID=A0A7C5LS88_9PROT|nr:cation transporter [Hellea balneolensis]
METDNTHQHIEAATCVDGQDQGGHAGHTHTHGAGHNHYHSHSVTPKNERRMAMAAILTGLFMVAEVIGGYLSGSLALIADAGHMLTDCASLTLAWFAFRLSRKPADWKFTFGFERFSVLAALINGLSLFVIAGLIVVEAIKRIREPVEVMGVPMLIVAGLGLGVNILVFVILSTADKENLNVRAAALHVLGDLLGSTAAIIAALVIWQTGFMPIDPIVSVIVALIILRSAWYVVKESGHILLEGAPEGLDRRTISADLHEQFPEITAVDHIHAWSITQERPMITLEAHISDGGDVERTAHAIKARLNARFGVEHATVEVTTDAPDKPRL